MKEPMPDWFTALRPHQTDAIEHVIDAFRRGKRMVLVDAPTGSGKTVIGEMVRREMGGPALYVCHGLELQDQFVRDFHAPVLKGRSNYPTVKGGWDVTADSCQGAMCRWCPTRGECPYTAAKEEAARSRLAVLNTAYYLTETNGPGRMKGREMVVLDEADTLEGELLRWAEFRVTEGAVRRMRMAPPKKGARWATMMDWLYRWAMSATRKAGEMEPTDPAEARRLRAKAAQVYRLFPAGTTNENWVREYERRGGVLLRPVRVDSMGRDYLWRHARRHLLMSATMIGPDFMLRDLGWDEDYEIVTVPSTFPVENRRIHVLPVATMTAKGKEQGEWERMADAVAKVVEHHRGENVLVHTVSYELAEFLHHRVETDQPTWTYRTREERGRVLSAFKKVGGVLFAASMDRGIDLPDDLCRVQVVAKLPFPYLGDKRVSARLHGDGGQVWYNLQTIRTLVQMTGRGVRHADDWAATYILDRSFVKNWSTYKMLLPKWWTESVVLDKGFSQVIGSRS